MLSGVAKLLFGGWLLVASLPATSTYKLNSYGFGNGGTAGSSTANYSLEGISGEQSGQVSSTSNYSAKPGFVQTEQANVPKVTLSNPAHYYDRLKFVIDTQGNPTDAKYALSISTDNFSSDIRYVKADLTVGSSLSTADYQTYTAWGGASGNLVIGLAHSTTYQLRARATQGQFTESAWGPSSAVATEETQLTFNVSPNTINFGSLLANTVNNSPSDITASIDTNANNGAQVYIQGKNGGLTSSTAGYTLQSATADLASAGSGFGVRGMSATSPLAKVSPYDNASTDYVGIVDSTIRAIFASSSPTFSGSGVFRVKAKPTTVTPDATDYNELFTVLCAANF